MRVSNGEQILVRVFIGRHAMTVPLLARASEP